MMFAMLSTRILLHLQPMEVHQLLASIIVVQQVIWLGALVIVRIHSHLIVLCQLVLLIVVVALMNRHRNGILGQFQLLWLNPAIRRKLEKDLAWLKR